MPKLVSIIGARPQIIKAAAISRVIQRSFQDKIQEVLLHTGQHYDDRLSDIFFRELDIPQPRYNLNIGSYDHPTQIALMMQGIEEVLLAEKPDAVLVFGDTNSTLAGALTASKMHIPVAHIEAGLRSFNKKMPEENNRIITDHLSAFLFVPCPNALVNLQKEGFALENPPPYSINNPLICNSGDVMYDNFLYYSEISEKKSDILSVLGVLTGKYLLATLHRDSNTTDSRVLHEIFSALAEISRRENALMVLPLHPRTRAALIAAENKNWENFAGFKIIEPVSYFDLIQLIRNAEMIITDSGGIQKEAYFSKKKCLVLRNETEWTELTETGMLRVGGVTKERIIREYLLLKEAVVNEFPSIYGNGDAAEQICSVLTEHL